MGVRKGEREEWVALKHTKSVLVENQFTFKAGIAGHLGYTLAMGKGLKASPRHMIESWCFFLFCPQIHIFFAMLHVPCGSAHLIITFVC